MKPEDLDTGDNDHGRFRSAQQLPHGKLLVFREKNGSGPVVMTGELLNAEGKLVKAATHSLIELNRIQVEILLLNELGLT
ncbi:hypothetical protein KKF55_04735 [Patescibacteria group bacterium]|nr:hypothetical protein [Patescibacteria group bacterium]